ncbi:zinc finger protein-like 1 homolog isoform X2 [Homalodisca vitripennis]|uniref:zinc finger protein-like 1 homolog isoform X2 n=1 Tax=Homalodisca vitripennis TaxID=197043 RepID=UPI001EEA585E|nr:zinc finger protein-like 1 homolog isoform X2 [Homalodisca vitripennis]
MGLCKCPKRRVTNQFCFEHRVNVCEYCIVTKHPKCVVQSYLRWLQDCDYSPKCVLCSKDLIIEDCVRLTCYHVFHWACLDQYARRMPATTAPAGYTCPSCKVGIFPPTNLVSQVADVLREKLAGVNWARIGLGLPLLSEEVEPNKVNPVKNHVSNTTPLDNMVDGHRNSHDAVVHVEEPVITYSRTDSSGQQSRRVYKAVEEITPVGFDHDENKYKRKSFLEWFKRWLNTSNNRRYHSGSLPSRYCKLAIGLVVAIFMIIIFVRLGRLSVADDPALDPMSNPNIKVNE